jgi:hypothetical protein
MAASLGAGISMGFAEALSDDGSLTGRGHPWVRGLICGAMTTLGGIGHTLPFLIKDFPLALGIAIAVVLVELGVITWVRHRYIDTPTFSAALQVGLGGALVFITGYSLENRKHSPKVQASKQDSQVQPWKSSPSGSRRWADLCHVRESVGALLLCQHW